MNKPLRLLGVLAAGAALLAARMVSGNEAAQAHAQWSAAELQVLRSLHLDSLPPAEPDPSNAYERAPGAAALGKKIFFDTRFSANQKVACASCHLPERQFQDGRPLGQGMGTGLRRTMPIVEGHRSPWQFWDGRKDSVWSQALGPLEDALEHGGNRTAYARLIARHYQADYQAVFHAMPGLEGLPDNAGPLGTATERAAWEKMSDAQRKAVSQVYANMGKAIAAYERTLRHAPSRFDGYVAATLRGDPAARQQLSVQEQRGLRLFIGKAQCVTCHNGPLFTDQHFHNTGVPPRDGAQPDQGRAAAIAKVLRDEFNCLGPFSDAPRVRCQELEFIAGDDPHMVGAFKTPGLRNVAGRAPYMHAGQIATLHDVVRHYARAPRAAIGHNERRPVALSEGEIDDLVKFLGTLSGAIEEAGQ